MVDVQHGKFLTKIVAYRLDFCSRIKPKVYVRCLGKVEQFQASKKSIQSENYGNFVEVA
jgi:hypothetical protein